MIKIFDYIFDSAFFIEMVFKMLGLGFKNYWLDAWNVFDAIIVISSIADLIVSNAFEDQLG